MLVLLVANAHRSALEQERTEGIYVHTLNVLLATSELKTAAQALARNERSFLMTGEPRYLALYRQTGATIPRLSHQLRRLTQNNPRQQQNLEVLNFHLRAYVRATDRNMAVARSGHAAQAIASMRSDSRRLQTERTLGKFDRMDAEERRLLALRKAATDRANRRTERFTYGLAGTGGLLLLWWQQGSASSRCAPMSRR